MPQHVARHDSEHPPSLSSLSSISTDKNLSPKKSDRESKSIPQHVARNDSEHPPSLSRLSSISTDEDEPDLELDLSTFGKARTAKLPDPSTHSVAPLGVGPRRSARHADLPAPDYARKLELFRAYSPPSGKGKYDVDAKGKGKAMVPDAFPLDMLLKDRDREGARKARIETKRKRAHSDASASDPALSTGSNLFEKPKRVHPHAQTESPFSDMWSPHDGPALLKGAAAREEWLGKKGAKAVGKILNSDRKKKSNTEEKQSDVLFWSKDVKQGDNDIVPDLVAPNSCHPLLTALNDAMNRKGVGGLLFDI
ncbi:hypothetical protein JB92DRAFT_1637561 [Gautieria morchelliformis]|nr:hypothetical protein JB92DRAFT_1637561 [Gautieria morchelliformis]